MIEKLKTLQNIVIFKYNFTKMMFSTVKLILITNAIQTILKVALVLLILITPSYIAYKNELSRTDVVIVRCSSIIFGWTIIGYLFALIYSIKK